MTTKENQETSSVITFTISSNEDMTLHRVCSGYYRTGNTEYARRCIEISDEKLKSLGMKIERLRHFRLKLTDEKTGIVFSFYSKGQIIFDLTDKESIYRPLFEKLNKILQSRT